MLKEKKEAEASLVCSDCGKTIDTNTDYTTLDNGNVICQDCIDENYFWCDDCELYYKKSDMNYYFTACETQVCQDCYDDHYFTCGDCGYIYHNENNYGGVILTCVKVVTITITSLVIIAKTSIIMIAMQGTGYVMIVMLTGTVLLIFVGTFQRK